MEVKTHLDGSKMMSHSPFLLISMPTTVRECPSCCRYSGCFFDMRTGEPLEAMSRSCALGGGDDERFLDVDPEGAAGSSGLSK